MLPRIARFFVNSRNVVMHPQTLRLLPLAAALQALLATQAFAADEKNLDAIVVTAPRSAGAFASSVGGAEISTKKAATSDAASLLKDIPGVSLQGAGGVSSLPAIHGLADDRLRIKVDGMDLISACGNHMNPPLSYIDPSNVASIKVFAGIAPVSSGGDSIGGSVQVDSASPEFAATGSNALVKGEVGVSYRSNGNGVSAHLSGSVASDRASVTYSGSTTESENYKAGGDFKPAGLAFIKVAPSVTNANKWLGGDEVGSSRYKSTNHSLGFALRNDAHLLELKLGVQDIPAQGFPNQRMDMTANDAEHVNLRYKGRFDWGGLEARVYQDHTRHKMNFLEDKAYWYSNGATGMPMDTEGRNTGALVKADIGIGTGNLLRVGGEYQRYRLNDWWEPSGTGGMSPLTFWNINNGQRDRLAAFAEWEAQWNPQWMTQIGLRSETVKMSTGTVQGYKSGGADTTYTLDAAAFNAADRNKTDHNWDLTALARHTASAMQAIEFGYARKTRSPNLYERYTWSTGSGMVMNMINMTGDGNGYVGNLDLKPETAHTLSATFDWHDAERENWSLKLTPYTTYISNYINAKRCGTVDIKGTSNACTAANLTATNNFVFLKYVNQDARLYGLDISGDLPLARNTGVGSFNAHGTLSYVRGKTTSGTEDDLYNIMPLNAKVAVTHSLGSWTNILEAQFVSAKSHVSQIRNEQQTGGYSLFNLRSSYEWKQVRLDVGVENIFDKLYSLPLGGAYVGQGTTMPPGAGVGRPAWGYAVAGIGRNLYAGMNYKF